MFIDPESPIEGLDSAGNGFQPDEHLCDAIWRDLGEQIPIEQVRQAATEIAAEYLDATVTLYLPLIIWRRTRQRLLEPPTPYRNGSTG